MAKTLFRKALPFLLAVFLLVGALPMAASAAGGPETTIEPTGGQESGTSSAPAGNPTESDVSITTEPNGGPSQAAPAQSSSESTPEPDSESLPPPIRKARVYRKSPRIRARARWTA